MSPPRPAPTTFRGPPGPDVSTGERLCAVLLGLELGGLGWCAWSLVRTYRAVKGHHG